MPQLGTLPIPKDFKSLDVFLAGRPRHKKDDPFWSRHPNMDPGKRAKIFAPFDALRGFSAQILAVRAAEQAREQ